MRASRTRGQYAMRALDRTG